MHGKDYGVCTKVRAWLIERVALDDLGILSRYMGDIGESAVLRYLIINEIRKVPAFFKPPIVIKDYCESLKDSAISRKR